MTVILLLQNLTDRLRWPRWLVGLSALGIATLSIFTLWFLFSLKEFSSNVRDTYETPPGIFQYLLFALIVISLSVMAIVGLLAFLSIFFRRRKA